MKTFNWSDAELLFDQIETAIGARRSMADRLLHNPHVSVNEDTYRGKVEAFSDVLRDLEVFRRTWEGPARPRLPPWARTWEGPE